MSIENSSRKMEKIQMERQREKADRTNETRQRNDRIIIWKNVEGESTKQMRSLGNKKEEGRGDDCVRESIEMEEYSNINRTSDRGRDTSKRALEYNQDKKQEDG